MADLSNAFWSETDASNNNASPNGWPEGMMPSGVNDAARADKGALKRFWDRHNPIKVITPAGGTWHYTTDNPSYPTAYVDGEIYSFVAAGPSSANEAFYVNALPAKTMFVMRNYAWTPIAAYDITVGHCPVLIYQAGLNSGAGGFALLNPYVPIFGNGTYGAITTAGALTVNGALSATSGSFSGNISGGAGLTITAGVITTGVGGTITTGNGGTIHSGGNVVADGSIITAGVVQGLQGVFSYSGGGWALDCSGGSLHVAGSIATAGIVTCSGGTFSGAVTISAGGTALNLSGGSLNVAGSITTAGIVSTTQGGYFGVGGPVTIAAGGTALDVSGGSAHVAGSINVGGDVNCLDITASVQGYKPGGGAWAAISDVRTKETDIADYTRGLDAVMRLHPVSYRYNGRAGMPRDGRTLVGLVADDVLPVMPEMVGMMKERLDPDDAEPTDILTLDTTALIFALVNSVKALAAEVAALKEK